MQKINKSVIKQFQIIRNLALKHEDLTSRQASVARKNPTSCDALLQPCCSDLSSKFKYGIE